MKELLPIAHKAFQNGQNLDRVVRNPGNPLRQKKISSLSHFCGLVFNILFVDDDLKINFLGDYFFWAFWLEPNWL